MTSDPIIWRTARQKLPLPLLMTQLGDGAHTKKGALCPFCQAKNKWAVFERSGRYYFKCQKLECVANEPDAGKSEIGYLALRLNLSAKDASKEYLKMAVPDLVPHLTGDNDHIPGIAGKSEIVGGPHDGKEIILTGAPAARNVPSANLWHALWKKLPLTVEDKTKLKVKRGFSDETIDTLGFRSNNIGNQQHLDALLEDYSLDELIAEGLYKDDIRGPKPSGQFFGYGITDQRDEKGQHIFEITEPPLIPYLDELGIPFYLRPHKGGVKKPKDELEEVELHEDEEPQTCASHVYSPYLLSEMIAQNDGVCVFTEGEFKAAALFQCGIAAIACPGITFVRNSAFKKELLDLLQRHGVTDLVIIFDNEEKDNPAFPSRYKADPWKRWDTALWAEYTAIDLREYFQSVGGSCRIGWLPERFRVDGKADCDGILAQLVSKYGLEQGTKEARKVFLKVIEGASEKPGLDLFPTEGRRIVECKLQRLFYKPLVLAGGQKEMNLARRFAEFDPATQQPVDQKLAELYRGLRGCYYKRAKPNTKEFDSLQRDKEAIQRKIDEIKAADDTRKRKKDLRILYARLAGIWERLKGLPEPISNFTISCEYKLHAQAGDVHRLVAVRDSKDRAKLNGHLRRLAPNDLARLAEFRRWCYATGEAVWSGGDKELQYLVQDMDHHSFLRDIHEVVTYGYHPQSNLWFFGDCAFDSKGGLILPDAANIIWHDGIGYQIEAAGDEKGSNFVQGAPLLMAPQGPVAAMEKPDISKIFSQFSEDLFNTIGGYDAWLCIGLMLSYGIAPELLKAGGHPGLWLFGKMSGGKTSIARWLIRIWGFKELGGIRIGESTTPTAMNRFLAQYNCLPVWMDEYRRNLVDAQREEVLRGAFDRSAGAKGIADHSNKTRNSTILTTPLVSGESSSGDAATRSRYGHVAVSAHRRLGDGTTRYARLQNECKHFYHIGRWIMENRTAFAAGCLEMLETWMQSPTVRQHIINERVRLVHGTAFACFTTMAAMLGMENAIPHPEGMPITAGNSSRRAQEFQTFLCKHGEQALQDVIDETFLSQFWRDIVSAIQRAKISRNFFALRYVTSDPESGKLTISKDEDVGKHVCFIAYDAVFAAYQQDKRARGEDPALQISDLRREMEKEPYWTPLPKDKAVRVHRITLNGHKHSCWVIDLSQGSAKQGAEDGYLFPFAEDLIGALESESDQLES